MSSSSSDEEDLSKFKEAADSTLYNDTLFRGKQAIEQEKTQTVALPSLRHVREVNDKIHDEPQVTPAFQKHVAKHLAKLLDSQLDLQETPGDNAEIANQARSILKAKRGQNASAAQGDSSSGVRLFGASAVFLSNLNIVPATPRKRKRGKIASFTRFSVSSDSSSEDNDRMHMQKLSAAAVSPDWVLNGAATKGWTSKQGKVERCVVNKSGILVSVKDDLSRGYESLNEISCSKSNSEQVSNVRANDDMAVLKLHKLKKPTHVESELAASFSSVVSIGSDSQNDVPRKSKKKRCKKTKHRIDHHSEDATTETTEVEDIVEERRKKCKKSRKCKRFRKEERKAEEQEMMKHFIPGLLEEDEDDKKRKKREKKKKKKRNKEKREEESYLKRVSHHKLSKVSKRGSGKKKMSKKVSRLSEDLAKLMMTPTEAS